MLTKYLNKIIAGNDLTDRETEDVMNLFLTGDLSPVQAGAFLGSLQSKGISASELTGGVRELQRHSVHFSEKFDDATDIVGTGGDGGRSFNISTAAALIAAGAGLKIAKHGGRASSGKCGSADVLEALGVDLSTSPATMVRSLDQNGIGFFFAPAVHPLMSKMASLRKQLGVRSFFNLLGPLSNPVPLRFILLGTAQQSQMDLFADALLQMNYDRAAVVSSDDGLDEISCFAAVQIIEIKNGTKTRSVIEPTKYFRKEELDGSLTGNDAQYNAQLILKILNSQIKGAPRSVCVLNAGTALYIAGKADSIADGIRLSEDAIDSGAALRKLNLLREASQHSKEERSEVSFSSSNSEIGFDNSHNETFRTNADRLKSNSPTQLRCQVFHSDQTRSKNEDVGQ